MNDAYNVSPRIAQDLYVITESLYELNKQRNALTLRMEILENQIKELVNKIYIKPEPEWKILC